MADDVELIIQLPRDGALDRYFRDDPPPSVASGRVVLEHLPADAGGRILPPPGGEVVLSVLSPEALRDAEQVEQVIRQAPAAGEPLVVRVQDAEELRDNELAAVLDAAAHTRRVVILQVLGSD
jgi:hypothetical protein